MRLTIEDVGEYLEQWHNYGGYGMAICPFHDDHSPSLRVTQFGYKCLSCNERGSLEKLYSEVSGRIVTREKIYNPSAWIWKNWLEKFGSYLTIAKIAHEQLIFNPDLGNYLQERKLDSQIKNGMMGYLDGYYTFPIRNEWEEVRGIVARASPTIQTKNNRYSVTPDCDVKLYAPDWQRIKNSDDLYVCYGTLDAWSLYMAGYASVTGISGKELNAVNLERFRKPIYIIPDLGEEKDAIELQTHLDWRGKPLFLDWEDGCKDINDLHMKFGLEKIQELVEKKKEKYKWQTENQ